MADGSQKPVILVVDDDLLIGELVALNLVREGYEVQRAYNGVEALKWLAFQRPALMLLDLGLPIVDGISVLSALRQRRTLGGQSGASFPVIVLTARQSAEDVKRVMALGANDVLAKPFETPELLQRIRHLIAAQDPDAP